MRERLWLPPRVHKRAEHVVHEGLITSAVGLEPLQYVVVNADIDMVLRNRDTHDGLRPVGVSPDVVDIGPYRRFEFPAGRRRGLKPVGPVLASRNLGFDLFSCIAHGIAFLPHLSLSL